MDQVRKIAIAVREDLETWQKLNLVSFVSSGIGTVEPNVIGGLYLDGSSHRYPAIFDRPVRVFSGPGAGIRRAFDRALGRELLVSVYTDDLFSTMTDEANRSAIAAVTTKDLVVAGFCVVGESKQVDKVFDKLKLHP